ncbi:hypothetical protein ACLI1A_05090 [Flavobacterium sp. RHBU_3]|uniref:hypothetical protein n=1 Tax=Flavobacterium sp. RHBU_3 TaxID=3391184 RepID=UPI003985329E
MQIISPTEGQVFTLGQVVEIKAKLKDVDAISSKAIIVTNESTDTVFMYIYDKVQNDHTLTKSFVPNATGAYNIEVSANGHAVWTIKNVVIQVD